MLDAGEKDDALDELRHIVTVDERVVKPVLNLAVKYLKNDRHDEAIAILDAVLNAYPDSNQVLFMTALAYEQAGNLDKAKALLGRVGPSGMFGADAAIRLAWLLEQEGDEQEAFRVLKENASRHPEHKDSVIALAGFYQKREQYDKALDILHKALEHNPSDPELLVNIAMNLEFLGRWKEGVRMARKALEINPDYVPALNFIGYVYADRGIRLSEAERLVTKALSFRPDDGYIIDSMGWVCYRQKRYALAVQYLDKAHELVPEDPVIIMHLGEALIAVERYERAIDLLESGLEHVKEGSKEAKKMRTLLEKARKKLWDMVDS
jgi:tetratricopeptide (TPR) repeat protein